MACNTKTIIHLSKSRLESTSIRLYRPAVVLAPRITAGDEFLFRGRRHSRWVGDFNDR